METVIVKKNDVVSTKSGDSETQGGILPGKFGLSDEKNDESVLNEVSLMDSGIMSSKSSDSESNGEEIEKINQVNSTENENSNSSSDSTLKGTPSVNNDEDSRSSTASSTSTITNSQTVKTNSESKSSFKFSSQKSSPEKQSDGDSSRGSQNIVLEDDSRSSCHSSQSRSTAKNSQPNINISDDESNSRSSFHSSSRKSSPEKPSQSQSIDSSQDNNSRSSFSSSQSRSTTKNSQPNKNVSDDESNSRSSFHSSSRKSSPEKPSQSQSIDSSQDNNSRSSFSSSQSRSTTKNSQPNKNVSDDESNSRSSFHSSSRKSSPDKSNHSQTQTSLKSHTSNGDLTDNTNSRSSFSSPKLKSTTTTNSQANIEKSSIRKSPAKSQSKSYYRIVDSDSEDDITLPKKSNDKKSGSESDTSSKSSENKKKSKIKNKRKLLDSDSDEKDSNSDKEQSEESDHDKKSSKKLNKSNKISDLIDSDSGSDNQDATKENYSSGEENKTVKRKGKKSPKKRVGSARASKEAAMREIHSETQRLIRESRVSLPYHKPKQRTLQEFLNRKKIISALPFDKNLTCAEKVKMHPEIISKVVEEKEKEAELFYKSSDSEEDEKNQEPMEVDKPIETKNITITEGTINTGESSDILSDKPVASDELKTVPQEQSLDQGVVRKLFTEDDAQKTVNTSKDKENPAEVNLVFDDTESMDVDVPDESTTEPMSEEKKNDCQKLENFKTKIESGKLHESNSEDIVLNMSETETDGHGKTTEQDCLEKNNKEPTVVEESSVDENKSKDSSGVTTEESDDPILKPAQDPEEEDEILDPKALRDDYGLPPEFEDEPVKKPSLKQQISAEVLKFKPKIKDSPGSMISFGSSEELEEGASKLRDRFIRHNMVCKPRREETSEVKVVRTEGTGDDVQIIEEVLTFKNDEETKPGEKLKKFKEDLKRKIVKARNEEWKQKEDQEKEDEDEEAKCMGDDFYEGLPDEEEILEDEESEAESEPEEDDVPMVESRRKKCDFGDDEAEESECDEYEDVDEKEKDQNDDEESEESDEEEEEEEEEEESDKEIMPKEPKKLKRIIKAFDEDSDEGESNEAQFTLDRSKTADEDMFATQAKHNGADEVDEIPDYQHQNRNQLCKTPLLKPNALSLISPVAHLTALNTSLDSAKKSASKTSNIQFGNGSTENTPKESERPQMTCNMEKMLSLQKKLFDDPPESVNEDEILEVCSGQFSDSQSSHSSKPKEITDSQLMDLCSGSFVSQTLDPKFLESDSLPHLRDETSQDLILTLDDDEDDNLNDTVKTASTVKRSDDSMFSSDSKSPLKPCSSSFIHKKQSEVSDTQLMNICSGKFTTQNDLPNLKLDSSGDVFKSPLNVEPKRTENKLDALQLESNQSDTTDSQLMDVCSGAFSTQPVDMKALEETQNSQKPSQSEDFKKLIENNDSKTEKTKAVKKPFKMDSWLKKSTTNPQEKKSSEVTDTQLMDLCSGAFTTQPANLIESEDVFQVADDDFELALDENTLSPNKQSPKKQTKADTKKSASIAEEEESKAPWSAFRVLSSSDEDEKESEQKKKSKKKKLKKKKVQMLQLSDDEEASGKEIYDEEESEFEEGYNEEEDEEKFVDYDSEENEVVVVPKKEIKKVAAKFLENEAELSESEWESDDEDEKGLDRLEFEEGDAEDIDEDKVRNELDKIRMKQVLDEDQRDVRMLQEILFDDGDLHSEGGGRERKFKWKNIDNMGDDEPAPLEDENGGLSDDEIDAAAEVQIRKMRYEQQKFLEEKEKSMNQDEMIDDDFGESQIFKMGMKLVSVRSNRQVLNQEKKLSTINENSVKNITTTKVTTVTKTSFMRSSMSFNGVMNKGSFLSRGEESLTRIAQNMPEKKKGKISAAQRGNFVFKHLSPSVNDAPQVDSEQENDTTPAKETASNKRKRKKFLSQTPTTSKKSKTEERAPGKKLF